MIPLIETNREALQDLCIKHRVARLEIFGSAADGSFNPETGDLDFLVEYLPLEPEQHFDACFGLLEDLQKLFRRRIDLIEAKAMRNPCFVRRVNESRMSVYDA